MTQIERQFKNIRTGAGIILLFFFVTTSAVAADSNLDRALETLLAGYDIQDYLEVRDDEEMSSGYYQVRTGDTLDDIILRAIGETPIRKNILRDAFVSANPNSFRNGNPNYLLAGLRLRIPDAEDIVALLFDMNSREMRGADRSRDSWVHFP
ncbi:MAG: hypothetical protein P8P42_08675 [Gammaproteobacteria bacterium]|nr:hypothetical protein [Gammaproteobacteria bacterium]